MAIFKCNRCGGTVEDQSKEAPSFCSHCGAQHTMSPVSNTPRSKKLVKTIAIVSAIVVVAVILLGAVSVTLLPKLRYNSILSDIQDGEYTDALAKLEQLEESEGFTERVLGCYYKIGLALMDAGDYTQALSVFESISWYSDSSEQILQCHYSLALAALEERRYTDALTMFEGLDGYGDSAAKISECHYGIATMLMESGEYYEALNIFKSLEGFNDSADRITQCRIGLLGDKTWNRMKNAKVGDTFVFGSYEQDNNISNGKEEIEWQVLAKDGSRILVISKYALDSQLYNVSLDPVTWETCSLRQWLNVNFLQDAFSDWQQDMIPTVTVYGENNYIYGTRAGTPTQDQIFLLSIQEAVDYFWYDDARRCLPTTYAKANGAWTSETGYCYWWLRTPGDTQWDAAAIFAQGGIHEEGNDVNNPENAVRPAMWIDLDI